MGLTHHEGLSVLNLFLLPLQLGKVILEQARFFLEVLLKQCKHLSEELVQLLFDLIRVAFEPSHLFQDHLHLLLDPPLLLLSLPVPALQPLQGRLICGLQLLDLVLCVPAFTALPTFDYAHGA